MVEAPERSGGASTSEATPSNEVSTKRTRRRFSAEYKRRILREADACTKSGELGALLRREGIYSSVLHGWRAARDRGEIAGLSKKRGRKRNEVDARDKQIAELQRALNTQTKRAERAEAIVEIQKKPFTAVGDSTPTQQRGQLVSAVQQHATVFAVATMCLALGVARATFYRRVKARLCKPRTSPQRKLGDEERGQVLMALNADRFCDLAPAQVYATLLDEGTYLCSERTMYRVLAENAQVRERRAQRRHPHYAAPQLLATGPNQVWSWDITKLMGPAKWTYFHLYVILDVFSRYVVGWLLADKESAALAKKLIEESCSAQRITPGKLTVHADRGTSMKSKPVALLLADLGATKSHSRPQVSNDNPFSEAQFRTLKYRPDFPERFGSLEHARQHCVDFFRWYNHEHYHSGLALLTPHDVHHGKVAEKIALRKVVLANAFDAHPERFPRGRPAPNEPRNAVWINPPKEDPTTAKTEEVPA
ncbi:MAG: IS3 family transposase [Clostridia bacterium]|nr:IS3 family transposase [Deltaproteobacteria bacterium]